MAKRRPDFEIGGKLHPGRQPPYCQSGAARPVYQRPDEDAGTGRSRQARRPRAVRQRRGARRRDQRRGDHPSPVAHVPQLKRLRGTLLAVPIVNVFGFHNRSRYLPDRRDLNRSFPGSETGSLAGRLGHVFMSEIVRPRGSRHRPAHRGHPPRQPAADPGRHQRSRSSNRWPRSSAPRCCCTRRHRDGLAARCRGGHRCPGHGVRGRRGPALRGDVHPDRPARHA